MRGWTTRRRPAAGADLVAARPHGPDGWQDIAVSEVETKPDRWRRFTRPAEPQGYLLLTIAATLVASLVAMVAYGYASNRLPFLHDGGSTSASKEPTRPPAPALSGPPGGPEICGLSGGHLATKGDWGPARPTYTVENAQGQLATFDAITDNPNYGDERHFFDAKSAAISTPGGFCDQLQVVDGEVLGLRVYVENSAEDPAGDADNGVRAAEGSTIHIYEDSTPSSMRTLTAVLHAANTSPPDVFSSITLEGTSPFRLDLLDQVTVYSNSHPKGYPISSAAWDGSGALFGPDQANGHMAPGYKYSVIVGATVRVTYLST
jgi:hypothetical protein